MKYLKHLTLFIVIISLAVFLCGEPNKLLELYKKGTIKLTGDPEFGKNVDWERFFYDKYKEFIVASDGTMFVANSRQHNLMKFSKEGKLLNTFSQKGKGPGDVFYPGDMSILDNKYLVVGEYASNRRISLFDLNALSASKRCKVLKTKHSAYFAVALKNNKVAYMSYKYSNENQKEKTITTSVYIIDAKTQNTKRVVSHRFPNKSGIIVGRMMVSFGGGLLGEVYIASTKNGNLLVGGSVYPELTVYSTEGKKLKTIPLDMKPVTVSAAYNKYYKQVYKDVYSREKRLSRTIKNKIYSGIDKAAPFGKNLPFYDELLVDSAGNILVFPYNSCIEETCPIHFRVYSPEGKYICRTTLDKGEYEFDIDRRFRNIQFTEKGIFGIFQQKGDDDILLRLIKININSSR